LRLGGEAGDHLILARRRTAVRAIGHFERIDQLASRPELIQHDLRGDAETGIGNHVIEHTRIGAVAGRGDAIGSNAVRRQRLPDGDVRGLIVIHRAADQQISRLELLELWERREWGKWWEWKAVITGKSSGGAYKAGYKKRDGQTCFKNLQPVTKAHSCNIHRKLPLLRPRTSRSPNVAEAPLPS